MNINKYTEKAQEAILGAQQLADREGHPEVTPEILLLTLLEQRDGIVPEIVRKMNADPAALAAAVRRLAADPLFAARLGAAGRETYVAHASEAVLGERWKALLGRALAAS